MDKPPAAFGDLQLVHAADNRSGQLMWYIKRSVLFVIDRLVVGLGANHQHTAFHDFHEAIISGEGRVRIGRCNAKGQRHCHTGYDGRLFLFS